MQKESSALLSSQTHEDPTKNSNPTKTTQIQDPTPHNPKFYFSNKQMILDGNGFDKSLLIHLKTSKSANYITCYEQNSSQSLQESQKVLQFQDRLTKLHSFLDARKSLENKHFLSTIQHLSSLSSLNLRFSGYYQQDKIPQGTLLKSLASLKNIHHLEISFQRFKFIDPKMLKKLMKALRKSTIISSLSLTLSRCDGLSSLHYQTLSSNMAKLIQLRTLKLNFNNLEKGPLDSDIQSFACILPKLPLLTQVELIFGSLKTIGKTAFRKLFRAFQSMKNLLGLTLNLPRCELVTSFDDEPSILECLKGLAGTSLQKLSLVLFRNFSNRHLRELSEALKELTLLKSLCLNFDWDFHIFDEPLVDFSSTLALLTSLTFLTLAFPSTLANERSIQSLSSALVCLQNLVSFKLELKSSDQIQDLNLQILFKNLKALRSLRYLDIKIPDQNKITDDSLGVLGESLKELILLRNLSLNFSQTPLLTNKSIEAICSAIEGGHTDLFHLSLKFDTNRNISVKVIQKLAETLKSLICLYSVEFDFGECLSIDEFGELLSVLGQLGNIQKIVLSIPFSEKNRVEVSRLEKIKDVTAYL